MTAGSSSPRVLVTGIGTINAIADCADGFTEALKNGQCGIGPITSFSTEGIGCNIGAEIRDFEPHVDRLNKKFQSADRFSQLAGLAAAEAIADAGLDPDEKLGPRAAVILGTSVGGHASLEAAYRDAFWERKKRIRPTTLLRSMAISGASLLSIEYGVTGPCLTINTACAAGAHSIGLAYQMIQDGRIDIALVGGSEAPLTWGILKAWDALRVLSPDGCRPFSNARNGLVLGEGAGVLVLEAADRTESTKTRSRAEIVGFGMTADAQDLVNPSLDTIAKSMKDALDDGGLGPQDVVCINAHGTATRANDTTETQAIHAVFGPAAKQLSISSTKSMHGHCLGSTGAIEAIAAIQAINGQFVPPTIGLEEPDVECDLDYTANQARYRAIEFAMSNSFAFGGTNAVLIFGAA